MQYALFQTNPHSCSYLPDKKATTLVADPALVVTKKIHTELAVLGFRRSGELLYKPHCSSCSACVPMRISISKFRPNRSQRRCFAKNSDLKTKILSAQFRQTHFDLYLRYIRTRHPKGGMDTASQQDYINFLTAKWSQTRFVEFIDNQNELVAVAIIDELSHGWSAVYTFFDPTQAKRSLGTYAILWQIEHLKSQNLPWLYLGYWVNSCRKMQYKEQFRPHQLFVQNKWE